MNLFAVTELSLPGVLHIVPRLHLDERGASAVTYLPEELPSIPRFLYEYTSRSVPGSLRGLHFQRAPHAQDKLIRVSHGRIFDVIADCDRSSPSFGQWVSIGLGGDTQSMVFIPGCYAHGFCVLGTDHAVVEYKLSTSYQPESSRGARWDDPTLGIVWPISNPTLSSQDASWPFL